MAIRFYQVKIGDRPAYWDDLGENITIVGVVLEARSLPIILLTPDANFYTGSIETAPVIQQNTETWSNFIQHSDDPKIFEIDKTGGIQMPEDFCAFEQYDFLCGYLEQHQGTL